MAKSVLEIKSLLIHTLLLLMLTTGCSDSPSDTQDSEEVKSAKELAIERICSKVTPTQVVDIYGAREAISELVQIDGSYLPLLEEMAKFISVALERTGFPKQYPDLQLLKSFCSSVKN